MKPNFKKKTQIECACAIFHLVADTKTKLNNINLNIFAINTIQIVLETRNLKSNAFGHEQLEVIFQSSFWAYCVWQLRLTISSQLSNVWYWVRMESVTLNRHCFFFLFFLSLYLVADKIKNKSFFWQLRLQTINTQNHRDKLPKNYQKKTHTQKNIEKNLHFRRMI